MKSIRAIFLLTVLFSTAARAADDAQDWNAFGQVLTLLQAAMRVGTSPNPDQAMAELLAGRNPEANQAIASLFAGATAEMPDEYRQRIASMGREFASLALKNPVSAAAGSISSDRMLQARKNLTEMGLSYYDHGQFLDAVKRNDELATQLFIAGKGVDLTKRAWSGRTALDIARDNGNAQLADLISRSLPATR
jgi:triphosphoribosyl-dephospho-CoA synthetase